MKLNPYLHFTNGKCEEALNFYVTALGAKPVMMLRYGQAPEQNEMTKGMADKIMHGRITLGDDIIMGSDTCSEISRTPGGFGLNIGVDSAEEAERLFSALSDGAEIKMPMGETFWAHRFGMLTDKFGLDWMVNCEKQG